MRWREWFETGFKVSNVGVGRDSGLYFFCACAPCLRACGALLPRPAFELASPVMEAWSLNPWTTRDVSVCTYLIKCSCFCFSLSQHCFRDPCTVAQGQLVYCSWRFPTDLPISPETGCLQFLAHKCVARNILECFSVNICLVLQILKILTI